MEGSATLTMDTSSTTMNWATQAIARITQSGTLRPLGVLSELVLGPVLVRVPASVPASSASDMGRNIASLIVGVNRGRRAHGAALLLDLRRSL
jgi:hypothetical protein